MTERKMLIELIQKGHAAYYERDDFVSTYEAIADHLLSNGVIVPPCKVGDTVYRIVKLFRGETIIVEGEVFEFAITHELAKKDKYCFYFRAYGEEFVCRHYSTWCDFSDFGKTVFLTKSQAEEALKNE